MKRLAIISSHPIQYNAPFFKALNASPGISVKVFYTWEQSQKSVYDPGYRQEREWDIPLLEGYEYEFIKNSSRSPGSHHFFGIINVGLKKKIREWQPDAILVYGWSFVSHLRVIKHFYKKVPILFRGDSTLLDEQKGLKTLLRRVFLKWVYRSIDFALYVGKHNYDYYRVHNVPEQKLVFVPHAVENERFCEVPAVENAHFQSIKEKVRGKRIFLFVGKLEEKKNPLLLLMAFKKLSLPGTALIFIGSGKLEAELKNSSVDDSNVHFIPFQNQSVIAEVYRLGEILVLPSAYNETWGLAVNEAMASGLVPIVSDKVGCEADLVEDGINGFVFASGDLNKLAYKMQELVDREKLDNFKQQSADKIMNYSIDENVHRVVSVVMKIEKRGK